MLSRSVCVPSLLHEGVLEILAVLPAALAFRQEHLLPSTNPLGEVKGGKK